MKTRYLLIVILLLTGVVKAETTARKKLQEVRAMISQQTENIRRMREELNRNPQHPDPSLLRNSYATATGGRSDAYRQQSDYMRSLIDRFESNTRRNVGGAVALATGGGRSRGQYIVEIDRSTQFIEELKGEEKSLLQELTREGAPRMIVEVIEDRDDDAVRPVPNAVVSLRSRPNVTATSGSNGEATLIKGVHIPDNANADVDITVKAKGYKEKWTTIPAGQLASDAGRYLVHLKKLGLDGQWQINQRNANGAVYTGTLKLTQSGSELSGSMVWSNHVSGTVRGTVSGSRVQFSVQYPGNLVGTYWAELNGDQLQQGTGRDNKGTAPCSWTGRKQ